MKLSIKIIIINTLKCQVSPQPSHKCLDFKDYIDMLSNLSQAQLLEFVENKGNQRKRAVFDFTKLQTQEAKLSGDMVNRIEKCVPEAAGNIALSEKAAVQRK